MTSEEISSRIATLNTYKNFFVDFVEHRINFDYALLNLPGPIVDGCKDSYAKTNEIYNGILNKSIPYEENVYNDMIGLNKSNNVLFTINSNYSINIKQINYPYYIIVALSGDLSQRMPVYLKSAIQIDNDYSFPSTYREFDFIPVNPFLFHTTGIKGAYMQYNPPKLINGDTNNSIITTAGFVKLHERDVNYGNFMVVGPNHVTPISFNGIETFKIIIEDFLKNTISNDNIFDETQLYGAGINHIVDSIHKEIGALTNTQTVRTDWQQRFSNLQNPLQTQNDIAEVLQLSKTLGTIEYGGDISFAKLEFCFHFTDGLDASIYSQVAEQLQIGTRQLISIADLKKKLKLSFLDHVLVYSTKEVTYTTYSTDSEGNITSSSSTVTIQVGYCKKGIFGLTNTRFSTALDYCLSFNSSWNKRCEFDKVVGFVLIIVGLVTGQPEIMEGGAAIMYAVQVILSIFLLSGRGSQKERLWASIALAVVTVGQGYNNWQSGTTTLGETLPLTNAQIMTNLNIGVMSSNALFDAFNTYQKNQWQNDIEDAQAKAEEAQKTLDEQQTEWTNFFYNDFYNMYDKFYNDLYIIK